MPKSTENTGSMMSTTEVRTGEISLCAQACTKKATAEARTPQHDDRGPRVTPGGHHEILEDGAEPVCSTATPPSAAGSAA